MGSGHHTISVHLRDELSQLVRRAFMETREVAEEGGDELSHYEHWRIYWSICYCVDDALLEEAQWHNDRRMRQLRLPNEIWLKIWEYLPPKSVISLSQTCGVWRSLALTTPRL
ncbi:hypothetical protein EXIGLDRAFT_369991 [Exidia glandulosa HHB12029]|uniref:F-box domain-containing protein n=1 Tax=Exidia glandulosa HHB12029 TaxID=1314781 RepID=A0A165C204_EXIGL|nr:hypothetical protein EXIGLDRAFT_369991 [Exidia glandulosa HHB12029]